MDRIHASLQRQGSEDLSDKLPVLPGNLTKLPHPAPGPGSAAAAAHPAAVTAASSSGVEGASDSKLMVISHSESLRGEASGGKEILPSVEGTGVVEHGKTSAHHTPPQQSQALSLTDQEKVQIMCINFP